MSNHDIELIHNKLLIVGMKMFNYKTVKEDKTHNKITYKKM